MPKFQEVKASVMYALACDEPILVHGEPGIGKTEMMEQIAEELDRPLWLFNAELYDTMDAHGVPVPDLKAGVTKWMRPNTLPFAGNPTFINPKHANRAGLPIVFFDELNRASIPMQSALHPAVLKTNGVRKVGEHHLQEGTGIVAAANRKIDKSGVNNIVRSFASRFTHVDLEADLEQWIAGYALNQGGNFGMLIAFLRLRERSKERNERMFSVDPSMLTVDTRAYPNARAWSAAVKYINAPESVRLTLLSGKVGDTAATWFNGFLQIMHELPNMNEVISNPEGAKLPSNPSAMFAVVGMVAFQAEVGTFDACLRYCARLGAEFEMIAVEDATKRNPTLKVTQAYIDWATRNQHLLN